MPDQELLSNTLRYLSGEDKHLNRHLRLKIEDTASDLSVDKTIQITGSKDSLIELALEILQVAWADFDKCHSDLGCFTFDEYDAELTVTLSHMK